MTWLQAPALARKLHDSGAAARSVLNRQGMAACLRDVIHRLAGPATPHFGDFREIKMPVLQVLLSKISTTSQCCADLQGHFWQGTQVS
jgi:hypothetical protein